MNESSFAKKWRKKSRLLTHILLISGALNIGLIGTFCYFAFSQQNRIHLKKSQKNYTKSITNAEVIKAFFKSSFDELVDDLKDQTLLEDGYTKRDLALSYLVTYHYFNIDQALSGYSYQKRLMTFIHKEGGESFELKVFPGLKDEHFLSIFSYIDKESWPFTPEGLFYELSGFLGEIPTGLKDAFYATTHFHAVYTLISRGEPSVSREEVLAMLIEGSWEKLDLFYKEQRHLPDYSAAKRKELLHNYIKQNSKIAAYLLIQLEPEYAIKKISDHDLLNLIQLLNRKTIISTKFLKQLLVSVRSDEIRNECARVLFSYEGINIEGVIDYEKALIHFLPSFVSSTPPQKYSKNSPGRTISSSIIHVVQEGDSLWKIAKKYQVGIEEIIAENDLSKSQVLMVGKKLKIPKK